MNSFKFANNDAVDQMLRMIETGSLNIGNSPSAASHSRSPRAPRVSPRPSGNVRSNVRQISSTAQWRTLLKNNNPGLVVAVFKAEWCPSCVAYTPDFAELSVQYDNVTFASVDTDANPSLSSEYGVSAIPATFLIKNGRVQEQITGRRTMEVGAAIGRLMGDDDDDGKDMDPCLMGDSDESTLVDASYTGITYYCAVAADNSSSSERLEVENQFMTSLAGIYKNDMSFRVTDVRKVVNPRLMQQFRATVSSLRQQSNLSAEEAKISTMFHGTDPKNVESICDNNLLPSKVGSLDDGFYGAGFYFSPHADYTFIYNTCGRGYKPFPCPADGTVILFDVITGRRRQLQALSYGASATPNFHCHTSPKKFEYVIFDVKQCLPRYVIKFRSSFAKARSLGGNLVENS